MTLCFALLRYAVLCCRAQSHLTQAQARNAELERLLAASKTELAALQVCALAPLLSTCSWCVAS